MTVTFIGAFGKYPEVWEFAKGGFVHNFFAHLKVKLKSMAD